MLFVLVIVMAGCPNQPSSSPRPTPTPIPIPDWHHYSVDSGNDVGKWSSIAISSSSYPRISYYDATNQKLKYAEMSASGWSSTTIDTTYSGNGSYSSIALDSYNNPNISCYRSYNGCLYYYNRVGSTWYRTVVDNGVWGSNVYWVGSYSSIALDDYNNPHISFYNETSKTLHYARHAGEMWYIVKFNLYGEYIGKYSSIALDSNNNPHIVCYDETYGELLYGAGTISGSSVTFNWTYISCGSDIVGQSCSIAVDSSNNIHISYLDSTTGYLKYAKKAGGIWSYNTFNTYSKQMGNYHSSIAVDNYNYPHISCYDTTTGNLWYLKWNGSSWNSTTIYSTSNYIGKYSDIAVFNNNPMISYYDSTSCDLQCSSFGYKSAIRGNSDLKMGQLDFTVSPGHESTRNVSIDSESKVVPGTTEEDPNLINLKK